MFRFILKFLNRKYITPTRKATFQSVMTGIAGQAVVIVSGIIVARVLGPEGRGYLALLFLFPVILAQLGSLGVPQSATYYIARDVGDSNKIYLTVKRIFLVQNILLVIIHLITLTIYISAKPSVVVISAWLTLVTIPGILAQQYGTAILQGEQKYKLFNILRLAPATIYAFCVLVIFLLNVASLPLIVLVWVVSNLIIGFISFKVSINNLNRQQNKKKEEPLYVKQMLKFGVKGFIGAITPVQDFRLDQLVAGLFLSPEALGFYVVGQAFTNILRFIAQSAGMVLYPTIAANQDLKRSNDLTTKFFFIVAILNGAVLLALIILMPYLLPLFFGKVFTESIPVARILLVGAYFESLRRILAEGLRGIGKPEATTWAEVSMYPFLIVLIPLLAPFYGIKGLASATVVGYIVSLIVAWLFFKSK